MAGTIQVQHRDGFNAKGYNGLVVTMNLGAGASETIAVGTDFDVDMVVMSYDDQASPTAQLAWSISAGTITVTGDANQDVTIWVLNFPGF